MRLSDFDSAEQFGDVLFEQLQTVYQVEWSKPEAILAIQRSVEEIYRYYRLKDDASVIPDVESPLRVRFGGPDLRSLNFFNKLDYYYFSKYLKNNEPGLKKYFADEWIAKGGRSTVDLTAEQIEDIRAALGDRLKNVNDVNLERIVRGATVRARNWAHLHRMREGRIELARIVAVIDSRTSEICRFLDGKFMRVGAAAAAVDRFSAMQPGEFAKEMFESPAAKGLRAANDNAEEVEKFFKGKLNDKGVLDDGLLAAGYGMPPYHVSCRTRLVGEVITEAEAESVIETPAPAPEPPRPKTPPEWPDDPEALTVVRRLGGSTGAELVEDEFGRRFVRKRGANADHLREEFTADSAYRALGVPVPAAQLYETANGPVKLARWIEGQTLSSLSGAARDAAETELRKHFAADALLGNWDVIGALEDNVLVDQGGKVWRIDNGGALRFRAMGTRKSAAQWNDWPAEIWSMRDKHVGGAGRIFEKLELSELASQIDGLQQRAKPLLEALPADLQPVLKARLRNLDTLAADWRPGRFRVLDRSAADAIPDTQVWEDWLTQLKPAELQAVLTYTGPTHSPLNRFLRGLGTDNGFGQLIANLDAAFAKAQVEGDVLVYRGTSGSRNQSLYEAFRNGLMRLGNEQTDPGYLSTSYDEDVAKGSFGGAANEVVYLIRVPDKARAAYLGDSRVSYAAHERELLFPRGSKLRVDRIREERGSFFVEVVLIP